MKLSKLNIILPFFFTTSALFADNVEIDILRELKKMQLKDSVSETLPLKENKNIEKTKNDKDRLVDFENYKTREVVGLFLINEFKSAVFLLEKLEENNNLKNLKTLLQIALKLEQHQSVKGEIDYLLTFPFVDYFIISEVHKTLLINNEAKEAIRFLENVKVSPFSFLKSIKFSEKEIQELGLEPYVDENGNTNLDKQIKLALTYEKADRLLDSYDTYTKNNHDNVYNNKINELRQKIEYRIKLYSNYEEKNNEVLIMSEKFDNINIFKMSKSKLKK